MQNLLNYLKEGARAFKMAATDIDPRRASVLEVAAGNRKHGFESELFGVPFDIPASASAANGISNKMVADKPLFADRIPEVLELLGNFDDGSPVLVSHYATYEMDVIKAQAARTGSPELEHVAGLGTAPFLCTLRLTKNIMRAEVPSLKFGLNELRYAFDLPVDPETQPGRAIDSAKVVWELFKFLCSKAVERGLLDPDSEHIGAALHELCWNAPVPGTADFRTWPFAGKHQGWALASIPDKDILWYLGNIDALQEGHASFEPDLYAALGREMERRLNESK